MSRSQKHLFFFLLSSVLLSTISATAANLYWYGQTSTTFSTASNWSTSSTSYVAASAAPGTADMANFGNYTGMTTANCSLTANASVGGMQFNAAYTGTFTQSTYNLTVGSTGATFSGGTFSGGSGTITVTGAVTISGCAFTSTSGTMNIAGNYTLSSGSFTDNGGLVYFNPSGARTYTGSTTFNNIEINPTANASTLTISSGTTFTVTNLTISGTHQTTLSGTGTIDVKGDITVSNTYVTTSNAPFITITGTGTQNLYGQTGGSGFELPNVTINKSSGTLYLFYYVLFAGDLTYTAGTIDAGTSTVGFVYGSTITGTFSLNNVTFASGGGNVQCNIATGSALTVNGALSITYNNSSGYVRLMGGTIHAKGNVTVNNTTNSNPIYGGGTTVISIDGTANQTLTGSTTSNAGYLPSITINKSSGTLTIANTITTNGNLTYTAGTLSLGSSGFYFYGTNTVSGSVTLNDVSFVSGTKTIASGTTLTTSGTLTVGGTAAVTLNTGNIYAQGDINVTNTSNAGGGSATITINGAGNQAFYGGTTTSTVGRLCNIVINKTSGTLSLYNSISVTGNWTYTAGTLSIGTSLLHFFSGTTITGTHTLKQVVFASAATYTIASGTILTVDSTLTYGSSTGTIIINGGDIYAKRDISILNPSTGGGGTTTITINGTVDQTLTGSGTAGQGSLPKIVIDKTSGTLFLASVISVANNWSYIQGTVAPQTSSVAFYGSLNLDGQGTGSTMPFYNVATGSGTVTLTGNLDANNNLNIGSGTTLSAGGYTINVGGSWTSSGTWTYGTSTVIFDGSGYRQVTGTSGTTINFYNLIFNRRANSIKLSRPVKVNHTLTMTLGRVISSSTNFLEIANDATCTTAADSAYVCGPVRKTGDDAFTFPVGDTLLADSIAYHPLAMTAPSSTSDQFEAVYYAHNQTYGVSLVDSLESISDCEYWTLERKAGSSTVTVTASWNSNSCGNEGYGDMRLSEWNGTQWADLGGTGITVNGYTGSVTASFALALGSSLSPIGFARPVRKEAYAILRKKLDAGYTIVNNGMLMFKFDEEYYDTDNKLTFTIYNDENTVVSSSTISASSLQKTVYYGDNRYLLNILDCGISPYGYLGNGFYVLEIVNEKNEHWFLRFKHVATIVPICPDAITPD